MTSCSPRSRWCSCGRFPNVWSDARYCGCSIACATYTPTSQSVRHGLDADQLHHYLSYCSEMLSLTAKTAALCAEHSADGVVLETVSYIETLTTELSNKIWQKISLLPGA